MSPNQVFQMKDFLYSQELEGFFQVIFGEELLWWEKGVVIECP